MPASCTCCACSGATPEQLAVIVDAALLALLLCATACAPLPSAALERVPLSTSYLDHACSPPACAPSPAVVTDHNTHDYGQAEGLSFEIVD